LNEFFKYVTGRYLFRILDDALTSLPSCAAAAAMIGAIQWRSMRHILKSNQLGRFSQKETNIDVTKKLPFKSGK